MEFRCGLCERIFNSSSTLSKHYTQDHPGKYEEIVKEICKLRDAGLSKLDVAKKINEAYNAHFSDGAVDIIYRKRKNPSIYRKRKENENKNENEIPPPGDYFIEFLRQHIDQFPPQYEDIVRRKFNKEERLPDSYELERHLDSLSISKQKAGQIRALYTFIVDDYAKKVEQAGLVPAIYRTVPGTKGFSYENYAEQAYHYTPGMVIKRKNPPDIHLELEDDTGSAAGTWSRSLKEQTYHRFAPKGTMGDAEGMSERSLILEIASKVEKLERRMEEDSRKREEKEKEDRLREEMKNMIKEAITTQINPLKDDIKAMKDDVKESIPSWLKEFNPQFILDLKKLQFEEKKWSDSYEVEKKNKTAIANFLTSWPSELGKSIAAFLTSTSGSPTTVPVEIKESEKILTVDCPNCNAPILADKDAETIKCISCNSDWRIKKQPQ